MFETVVLKSFGLALFVSALAYLLIMKYIFNDQSAIHVVIAILVGIACGAALVIVTLRANKKTVVKQKPGRNK
jgi:Na+/melibiose symporter-like transporter